MSKNDPNPPDWWYEPDEPEKDEESEEQEPDDNYLEDQHIQAIERDYDRLLNWIYK